MFDLIEDYQGLFERRMEGLLLGEGIGFFISPNPRLIKSYPF